MLEAIDEKDYFIWTLCKRSWWIETKGGDSQMIDEQQDYKSVVFSSWFG
jgi:hypothetical protein